MKWIILLSFIAFAQPAEQSIRVFTEFHDFDEQYADVIRAFKD